MAPSKKEIAKASTFLKGLANPHRLAVLCLLSEGEKNVGELIAQTRISQTSMSQHLAKLKAEKIVTARRDHRTLYYSIKNPDVFRVISLMHDLFCQTNSKKRGKEPKR
ncbi:MAG: metalloregulator ArsR/SmtB family transcription factor [Alphaproteobacteria bacterium]|nr:metalloregulator ArsR/SmtB family transcription factor [Alphaproteobacteria bacterium]